MASIADCKNRIGLYDNMSDDIKSIVSYLDKSYDYNKIILSKINEDYNIDNKSSAIYDRLKDLSDEIKKTSSYLTNTIISEISDAVRDEKATIKALEKKAEEEKARKEAEAARLAENNNQIV